LLSVQQVITVIGKFRGIMTRVGNLLGSVSLKLFVCLFLSSCSDSLVGGGSGDTGAEVVQRVPELGTTSASPSQLVEVDSITPCLKGVVPKILPLKLSFSSDSVPARAEDFALPTWLSLLAYKDRKTVVKNLRRTGFSESQIHSFDFFRPLNGSFSSSQGFVAQSARGRYVVFRGTDSPMDWAANFKSNLVQRPGLFGNKASVHQGFMELADSSFDEIFRVLKTADAESSKLPVWVVGHSLGGAQAALFALVAAQRGVKLGALITLAQPRVGNSDFAQLLDKNLGDRYVRLVRPRDIVPHVPPTSESAQLAARFFVGSPVPFSDQELARSFESSQYGHAGAQFELSTDGTVTSSDTSNDAMDADFFRNLLMESGATNSEDLRTVGFLKSKTLIARGLEHLPEGMMCALMQKQR
jgi:pimeloyl-ACP methyl ester carboxylesterase